MPRGLLQARPRAGRASARMRAASPSSAAMAAFAAAPKPAMPATFSVPARRPSSWPPPRSSGSSPCRPSASTSAPTPLGPPILCADSVSRSAPSRSDIERDFAERLDRIDMQQAARLMDDLGRFSDRLDRAGLVVGQHDRDQRRRAAVEQRAQMHRDRRRRNGVTPMVPIASARKPPARQHRGMLDRRDQSAAATGCPRRAASPASAPARWLRCRRR